MWHSFWNLLCRERKKCYYRLAGLGVVIPVYQDRLGRLRGRLPLKEVLKKNSCEGQA